MKIIFSDLTHGEVKLMPENLDDIWHVYNIIQENDLVRAITYRTEEQVTDQKRAKKTGKKKMKLGIRVKEVKFHEFSDRLRIHGVIEEGPQDKGSYHTFNLTADNQDKITIVKDSWKSFELERIKQAVEQSKQDVILFICLDDDTATIAILRQSGVQWISDIDSHRSGKQYESVNLEKQYFGEIVSMMRQYKTETTPVVVLGPGFAKERFLHFGQDKYPDFFTSSIIHTTGNAGMNGIHEAIKSGVIHHIAKENRVVFETTLVESLFEEIKKNSHASYGYDEVKLAIQNGAVDHLLLIDKLVRSLQGEEIIKLAQKHHSKFTIINTIHDAGKKLEGLGGIGAILRFSLETKNK
jgi:protein pelota